MAIDPITYDSASSGGFFRSLARDCSGNTLALMAAVLLPILGMIGGAVDMSRAYMASAKLQQACDAGVLAARKNLASSDEKNPVLPADAKDIGERFFELNFRDGQYATRDRVFNMVLEDDFAIAGTAEVTVPTAVMNVFGVDEVPVAVSCEAQMNLSNVDVMMAIDVTGSMRHTNPGDSQSRIDSVKNVIRDFHALLERNTAPGTRVRYGFVPYATNVNVGHLLEKQWLVNKWTYQSRELSGDVAKEYERVYYDNWKYISGSASGWQTESSYPATWVPGTPPDDGSGDQGGSSGSSGYYRCNGSQPADTLNQSDVLVATTTETYVGPPSGTKTIQKYERTRTGVDYTTALSGSTCEIRRQTFDKYKQSYDRISHPALSVQVQWLYKPVEFNLSPMKIQPSCIEERSTYHITDAANVDLEQALDLDIDLVPNPDSPDTQWRPRLSNAIFVRSINNSGAGAVTPEEVTSASSFAQTGTWWFSSCPAPALKLTKLDEDELQTYLDQLSPAGATYHDIGMIWAGRLLSPTGLFADENEDEDYDEPTNRNLIFLTDGETEPYDIAYGAYGVEALDMRRWDPDSPQSLVETIDNRFLIACNEIKKKNITVWIIAFGSEVNDTMVKCAGEGRYFEAADTNQLDQIFRKIAGSFGNLRLSK